MLKDYDFKCYECGTDVTPDETNTYDREMWFEVGVMYTNMMVRCPSCRKYNSVTYRVDKSSIIEVV